MRRAMAAVLTGALALSVCAASAAPAGALPLPLPALTPAESQQANACGLEAQKLGRSLDKQGRFTEAVAAFDREIECWGRFPDRAEWVLWDQRRAEQIRPEIRLFVSRPTATEPRGPLAKNEPAFGTMLGGTTDLDPAVKSDLGRVAATYGKPYAMVLVYAWWNQPIPTVAFENARKAGAALQVGFEPTDGLDAVQDNAYLRDFARRLKAYGHPVFLRYASEMNGAWSPWYGDPAKFIAKWQLVTRVMREEAPNVAMVWSPNFVGDQPWQDYYPGDEWVDWVGVNAYHERYFLGNPTTSTPMLEDIFYSGPRANPLDKLKPLYDTFAGRKPLMLSETGFSWQSRRAPGEDTSAWAADTIRRFYGYLPLVYPRLKAVSYFNVDFESNPRVPSSSHYLLSARPNMVKAFRETTAPDWYIGGGAAGPATFWRPAEQATLAGKTHVAAYVNLAAGVSRVDYLVDGKLEGTASALPWESDLNLTGLTGGHSITVRAYDKAGALGHERTYRYDASAIRVDLNGRYLDFDQPPVMLNDRVLVPARAILEALGAEIRWDNDSQTVIATRGGATLRLQIGNPVPTRNGAPLQRLDVPAQLIGGRTLVPARFVAENYQMDVRWDQATQTVIIRPLPGR